GNYLVASFSWHSGAGAATWGSGTVGVSGTVSVANSLVGDTALAGLQPLVVDDVNGTWFARFMAKGGGRVRVGLQENGAPVITSAADIPANQGGWLRLTVLRSFYDVAAGSTPITIYGAWRRVPETVPAGSAGIPGSASHPRLKAPQQLLRTLPA